MTGLSRSRDDFEQKLTAWLEDGAPPAVPDGLLEGVLAKTASTARRPGWWAPDGPADVLISRRIVERSLALAATIAALTLATVFIVAVGSRPQVPLPPGRPGWIVAARDGELQLIDATGTVRHRLSTGSYFGWGSWSRDGRRLAYVEGDPARPVLVIRDEGLADVARIDLPADAGGVLSWSPDGTSIAFGVESDRETRIYVVPARDGARPVPITDPALLALRPSWSPDGSLIAFRGGVAIDQQALYVMRPDGSEAHRLSQAARAVEPWCGFPWAPDGRAIVFSTSYAGVYMVNADGTGERAIIGGSIQAYCPSISPDGRRISAGVVTATGQHIQVVDLQTLNVVTPPGPLWDAWPALWSPDGSVIVSNGRLLGETQNPRVLLDPDAVLPSTTLFSSDAIVVDWQRLPP